MERDEVEIATLDGTLTAFSGHPDGGTPCPAVILYMDAPGIREELPDFARRIAGERYFFLLPDLYYRFGRIRLEGKRDEESVATYRAARRQLSNAMVASDTGAMLEFLDGHASVKPGGRGCVGFGGFITTVAGVYPDGFAAAAAAYGTDVGTDAENSPHLLAKNIKAELYYGFAEHDPLVPENVIPTLEATLSEHGVPHLIEAFPGTHKGFCFPQRDDVYDKASAERYWETLFALYRRTLG